MEPVIKHLREKTLIGKHASMSLATNTTPLLWKAFMQNRKYIENFIGTDLFSIQVYGADMAPDFSNFSMETVFEKWAATEVSSTDVIPEGMEAFTLPGGLYAVFLHRGPASDFEKTFDGIFRTWLPASVYILDNRPHFELLGKNYSHNSPHSEEEIWIPVKTKSIT